MDIFKTFIFAAIFYFMLKSMIVWENHKYVNDHEKSLINLTFFFMLANTFVCYLIIVFAERTPFNK